MEESQTQQGGRTRWFQRALPMAGLVLALVTLAVLALPSLRDQVALSTTRQPQPLVELFFTQTQTQTRPGAEARCGRAGGKAEVRFTVRSQLEETRRLAYRVIVDPADGDARATNGAVRIQPGETRRVTAAAPGAGAGAGVGAYTVIVRLPALDQELRAHCAGSRR